MRDLLSLAASYGLPTQRLQSSSFLVMTYFLLRDYNIQPKKRNYFGASGYVSRRTVYGLFLRQQDWGAFL